MKRETSEKTVSGLIAVGLTLLIVSSIYFTMAKPSSADAALEVKALSDPVIDVWRISTDTDAVTDKTSYFATNIGDGGMLTMRCRDGKYRELLLITDDRLDTDDNLARLLIRFDKSPHRQAHWNELKSGRGALTNSVDAILPKMLTATDMLVQYDTILDGKKVATFKLAGLREALTDMNSPCSWKM